MKKSTKKKIKKLWASTKKTAKIAGKEIIAAGKATRREVVAAGRGLERVGKGLSASGDVIQESFKPSATPRLPEEQHLIPQSKLIIQKKRPTTLKHEEFYKPQGYKKSLSFGWGGY